ncbi:winged helix-turn-helix transcriptional regulator [Dactylosporangium sp. CA-152071]|uniref:winged helix-turn-helix transcriptional regulator n=1 Tax=Dactylosporangium sp. CA-152071 TaxID=3239933 RepID=UPI003D8AB3D7
MPPRVDYALTEAGNALLEPMQAMGAWATRYADAVLDAQERFEVREAYTRPGAARRRRIPLTGNAE